MKETTLKYILRNLGIVGIILCSINSLAQAPSSNENYIKSTTYKVPRSNSITNPSAQEAVVEITYIDGLGRPKQKIAHKQAGDGGDLVTHIVYDGFGRQPNEFLPYVRSASQVFDANGLGNTTAFYSNPSNGPTTNNPWSEKLFEESPLNRVLKQAAPGNDWAINSGHEVKFVYETNTTNEVHYYKVNLAPNNPALHYKGKYPEGHLYKNVTKDENWQAGDGKRGTVEQFTDKMGRMVLKRTFGKSNTGNTTIKLDTYYVYDVYGNLTYVLPPKLSEQIPSSGTILQTKLDALAYQYKYDHRNRMIHKKIPGKNKEFMIYDVLDRLIATGPALSPFGDSAEGWLRTKYAAFNRVVYTFWQQGLATEQPQHNLLPSNPTYVSEERLPGSNKSTVNGVDFSYTNRVTPTSGYHILTINYYDDYNYESAPATIPSTVANGQSTVYYKKNSKKPKGLPTGSWVRELETTAQHKAITSYSLYDKKARPVRVKSTNSANGYTQTDTEFDFIGNPQTTITMHKKDAGATELVITDAFSYTPQSRPLKHTHKIGNGTRQLMALNQYDVLGRLESKKVGGPDFFGTSPLQSVDYKYNVRGWLTNINDVVRLSQPGDPLDLFAFKINYNMVTNTVNGTVKPLYNGNISESFWRTSSDNIKRKYGYSYDHQNRILDAYYQVPGTAIPLADSYSAHYSYDRNGNILTLERNGDEDDGNNVMEIDALDYHYDIGNKLENVRDNVASSSGYNDRSPGLLTKDFIYDDYGNLIADKDKEITDIQYNHLNLPTKITFSSGGKIDYFYDAIGIKLIKKVTDGTTITTTGYMDGFQYTNTVLDFFPHAEGYIKALQEQGTITYKYIFNYTDHLGNIRLKYTKDPSTGEVAILEENHYYPYGLKHKGYNNEHVYLGLEAGGNIILTPVTTDLNDRYKYKFGGKEYQDEFDINTYDFGARNYDPALGRWMNIDPLAEAMRRHSPYNYAFNNPIYFIDPDGMMPIPQAVTHAPIQSFTLTTYDDNGDVTGQETVSSLKGTGLKEGWNSKDDTYKAGKDGKVDKVDGKQYTDSKGNTVDRLYATDKKGNMTEDYVEVGSGALSTKQDGSGVIKKDGKSSTFKYQSLSFKNKIVEAEKVFKFLAKFTNVEFSLVERRNSNNISNSSSQIFTSFEGLEEYQGPRAAIRAAQRGTLFRFSHSHPLSNFSTASQSDMDNMWDVTNANINSQQSPTFRILYGGNYYGY